MMPGSPRRKLKPRKRQDKLRTIVSSSLGVFWAERLDLISLGFLYLSTYNRVCIANMKNNQLITLLAIVGSDGDMGYHGLEPRM